MNGALALIGGPYRALETFEMPDTIESLYDLLDSIRLLTIGYKVITRIEKVHAMPKQGVTSMFTFGTNWGAVMMGLYDRQLLFPESFVTPEEWQSAMGIPKRSKKKVVRSVKNPKTGVIVTKPMDVESSNDHKKKLLGIAQSLYPLAKFTIKVADAVLLAHYAKRIHEAELEQEAERQIIEAQTAVAVHRKRS